ncbi:hypothetical protein CLV43_111283 [Umezawaea tangerina]|uniref:Transposase IS110-like N-terminal domain-containing protein n=1 Tax=Umezawaea tangerina TaxID=84725 RepID=A0A2T0SU15_9PSEU|nr:hypothetical protein CLV43_111283 [Umezawaea tangerina]
MTDAPSRTHDPGVVSPDLVASPDRCRLPPPARTLTHTLRTVDVGDDALAELDVLVGFDDDLADEATRLSNRIRGLLTGIHPALERAIGPRISHPAVLEILSRCGGPTGIAKAGRRTLTAIAAAHAPRMGARRFDHDGAGRTDRDRSRHHRGRHGPAPTRGHPENRAPTEKAGRRRARSRLRCSLTTATGTPRCAQAIRVASRRAVFDSLPVPVLGSADMKTTSSGSHHLATIGVMCRRRSSAVAALPSRSTT